MQAVLEPSRVAAFRRDLPPPHFHSSSWINVGTHSARPICGSDSIRRLDPLHHLDAFEHRHAVPLTIRFGDVAFLARSSSAHRRA